MNLINSKFSVDVSRSIEDMAAELAAAIKKEFSSEPRLKKQIGDGLKKNKNMTFKLGDKINFSVTLVLEKSK